MSDDSTAKKATAKKATGKKATGKKATGKKATGKKAPGKKATGKKATANAAATSRSKKGSPRRSGVSQAERSTRSRRARRSPESAVESTHFGRAKRRATRLVDNPEQLIDLVGEANNKATNAKLGRVRAILDDVQALLRLVRAYARGTYRDVPRGDLVLVVAALIYFVSPLDLIPDVLGPLGLSDDAVVLGFVISFVKSELDDFRAWEASTAEGRA